MVYRVKKGWRPTILFRSMSLTAFLKLLHDFSTGETTLKRKEVEAIARLLPDNTANTIKKHQGEHIFYLPFEGIEHKDVESILKTPEEVHITFTKGTAGPFLSLHEYTKAEPSDTAVGIDIIHQRVIGVYNAHGKEIHLETHGQGLLIHRKYLSNHIGSCIGINLKHEKIEGFSGRIYLFDSPEDVYEYFNYNKHILALKITSITMADALAKKKRISGNFIDQWHDRRLQLNPRNFYNY